MTCNPNPKPLSSAEGMMKSWPYKNFSGRLEKRRICCISLYAIYVFGLFFFSSFLGTLLDILYLFVHFCFCPLPPLPPPLPPPYTPKINLWNGRVFIFLFALTVFRKRRGGGWIPPFCTFVTFVHGNHTGAF